MAAIGIEMMPEAPRASSAAGSGAGAHSSQMGALGIPNFDHVGYDTWVLAHLVKSRMEAYEANMGKVTSTFMRQALISTFVGMEENVLFPEERELHWGGVPKKAKKSVKFFMDVPYKHSRSGEVFEGPVTSQLTFEKELGEDGPVFVNPEGSE